MLAQATPSNPADAAAWGAYITALRGSVQTSWAGARSAYLTLKNVRAQLGMPFIAPPTGEGGVPDNGAWSDSLEDNMLDLQAMVKVTDDAFGDVLAQKRKLLYDAQSNDWAVEGLPGDLIRVKLNEAGQLSLADATNQPIHVGGTIGLAPLLIVAGVAAAAVSGAVTFVAAAIVIKKTCETIQAVAEEKTLQTALTKQAELVQSGKATPEQAAALTKSVFDGAAQVNESKAKVNESKAKLEAEKNKPKPDGLGDTIKTVAYVGLGIGVIFLLAKLIPSKSLLENPRGINLSDQQKDAIAAIGHRYRNAVRRGDVTKEWAATEVAGEYTYPYATTAHFNAVRAFAMRVVAAPAKPLPKRARA